MCVLWASSLFQMYNSLIEKKGDEVVNWKVWETRKTVSKQSTMSKKVLVRKEGTINELVEKLVGDIQKFPEHLLNANYQIQQYHELKSNVPTNWVVSIEDFANNWRSVCQDEIQSAHYTYQQATLLTKVATYKCPTCSDNITESVVFISADFKHDAHFVKKCHVIYGDYLEQIISVQNHVIFSDGCAAQFKSKLPFYFVAKLDSFLCHKEERSYFGLNMEKSPCDPLGGLVKRAATRHVLARSGV